MIQKKLNVKHLTGSRFYEVSGSSGILEGFLVDLLDNEVFLGSITVSHGNTTEEVIKALIPLIIKRIQLQRKVMVWSEP